MPWKDPTETIVGQDGLVYSGAVGSTLPTNPTAVPDPTKFEGHGYHNEDGIRTSLAREVNRLGSWQELNYTRIIPGRETFTIGFVLQQWNDANTTAAFGGGTITNAGGVYKYVPRSAGNPLDERAWLADIIDGTRHLRIIIPRGIVVETVESKFARTEYAELPVTVEALVPSDGSAPWFFYSDDAAAFAASS